MGDEVGNQAGQAVLLCGVDGTGLTSEADALDLVGSLWGQEVDWVVVPKARLGHDFLNLRSGLAGAVIQKFVNYRVRLAIIGDISAEMAASPALRDFVRESNAGDRVWFLADLAAMEARLAALEQQRLT